MEFLGVKCENIVSHSRVSQKNSVAIELGNLDYTCVHQWDGDRQACLLQPSYLQLTNVRYSL